MQLMKAFFYFIFLSSKHDGYKTFCKTDNLTLEYKSHKKQQQKQNDH